MSTVAFSRLRPASRIRHCLRLTAQRNASTLSPLVSPDDFPATKRLHYLNTANVGLMYSGCLKAIADWQSNVEKGALHMDEGQQRAMLKELKLSASKLFNCQANDVAVGSSATDLLSSLAWAFVDHVPSRANIVSTEIAHPRVVYPWYRVAKHSGAQVRLAKGRDGYTNMKYILEAIDRNTAVVCVSQVEYSGGQRYDLKTLADAIHENGGILVVNVTQSAGAIPIDVQEIGADVVVGGSYKWLCGPFGAALMYIKPELQERLEMFLSGFKSHYDMWDLAASHVDYPSDASIYEFGIIGHGLGNGLTKSIQFLLDIGIENIFEYNLKLADLIIERLENRNAEILSPRSDDERTSLVTFRFPGREPKKVHKYLTDNGIHCFSKGEYLRMSPHFFNTAQCIDNVFEKIDEAFDASLQKL